MQGGILNEIYQIKSSLSKRGGRETLLAKNLATEELVVVKLLKFGLDAVWEDFKLFEREAKTLKNINHPAIPQYLDYFELDLPYCQGFALVQEYIKAPSLEAAIQAGRTFSESEIKEISEALLNILQYLHQQQPSIIHRDIKPSNILLTDRTGNRVGQVFLIDFGAVKNVAAAEGGTITVVGTYGYMPPEQFGGKTTPASDLYSLGATLIYLATGRHPTELPSKAGKIVFEPSVQLSPALIQWLNQLIEPNCDLELDLKGNCRFKSATEALQALKQPISLNKDQASKIIKQPSYSKIKLRKTPAEISISILPQGFTAELILLAFLALGFNTTLLLITKGVLSIAYFPINLVFGFFLIPFWGIGLGLFSSILFRLFGKIKLKINSKQISLTYECLGIRCQRPQSTSRQNITAVERLQKFSAVIIRANSKAYTIQNNATVFNETSKHNPEDIEELDCLAQELSQWLKIPVTRH
ncbi:MAG: serine/threonine-protein kinase [Cyanobacteria bacterium J06621_8]